MGAILKTLRLDAMCDGCAKYVCNDATCHAKCSGCCELDMETRSIALSEPSDSSSAEISVDCCLGHIRTENT